MQHTPSDEKPERSAVTRPGFALGLLYGASLGVVLSAALGRPWFLAICIGAGMSLGLAFDSARGRRAASAQPDATALEVGDDRPEASEEESG